MLAALIPTTFRVIGHAENGRKGLRQFMVMDGWTDRQTGDGRMDGLFVCWLIACFRLNGPLRHYFSLYRAVSQRMGGGGGGGGEKRDGR